jgi:voltage-gated potassium channel
MKSSKSLVVAVSAMFLALIIGTVGFIASEQMPFFDALWLTVITIFTVGYGDTVPQTIVGRIFALLIVPVGIAIVTYATGAVTSMMIEGEFSKRVRRRQMDKKILLLENHVIICGLGRVGEQVLRELMKSQKNVVVIETSEERIEEIGDHILYIQGDATEDKVLLEAGIERAAGLVATLPDDALNVFVTLTAKGLNPNIQVVARAERFETEEKLRRAGADKVINLSSIGGQRMAMSLLKPLSIEYVETILHDEGEEMEVEEIKISPNSLLVGKTLRDSQIRSRYGITVVAIRRNNGTISNPKPDEPLYADDVVIVFGTKDQLEQFEKEAAFYVGRKRG